MPSAFIDGGVTGVSLMLNTLTGVSLSTFLVVLNLPFLILAYFSIGKRFAIKSVISIILLALVVGFFPLDRKSTRLNSSHVRTSYAVFCLKKKSEVRLVVTI